MVFFFSKVKFFIFWPKTMDYSPCGETDVVNGNGAPKLPN